MNKPVKVSLQNQSKIESIAIESFFHDSWKIQAAIPTLDPLEQFVRVMQLTPKWIDNLMIFRNRVVGLFGLKNLGAFTDIDLSKSSSDYKIGDRVGIFTLIEKNEGEVLLGDDDNHLSVVVSIYKEMPTNDAKVFITVSTVVHVKNWLGKAYMIPATPAHHIIARKMTGAIGHAA